MEKAEIIKSGYQEGGYHNIRKSGFKSRVNRCKSVSDKRQVEKTKPNTTAFSRKLEARNPKS